MTDAERGFLAAILADPGDDTHRLVYADWLEEHGGRPERAEFIRVQVELAALGDEAPDCPHVEAGALTCPDARCATGLWYDRRALLRARERALLDSDGWPVAVADGWVVVTDWARGFAREVSAAAAGWVAHGDAALADHPVERVCLASAPLLEGEEDGVSLHADPRGHIFFWVDVRAEAVRLGLDMADPGVIPRVVCGLRWPGVAFDLPLPSAWGYDPVGAADDGGFA